MGRHANTRAAPGPGGTPARDAAACLRAFEREFDYVYRALLRQGVAASDVEDLVQDVFLVTWRRWADFDTDRPLRPWLAGIAFKVASEHLKRRRRSEPRAWLDPPDVAPAGEEALAASRARALALHALAALEDGQRALIVLHDLDGLSMREIAGMFSVPLFTAYSRLRAARRALSDLVERALRDPSRAAGRPTATAILATEREPPPAPRDARRRSLSRLRGWLLLPAAPLAPAPPAPMAAGSPAPALVPRAGPLPLALGAGAAFVLVLAVAIVGAPARVERSPRLPGVPVGATAAITAAVTVAVTPAVLAPAPAPVVGVEKAVPGGQAERTESSADPIDRGLIGHWRLASTAEGTEAPDLSGNDNGCTVVRASRPAFDGSTVEAPGAGATGQPPRLDGDRFLICARPEPLARLRTEVTVALWVRPAPHTSERQVLIARQFGSSHERFFSIALENGSIELLSHAWKSVTRRPLPAGAGPWRHVAAIHKDDGRTALYVDGKLVGRSNKSRRAHLGGGSSPLTIGGSIEGPDPTDARGLLRGALGEVRLYERALRPAELRRLAAGSPPADDSADKFALFHQ